MSDIWDIGEKNFESDNKAVKLFYCRANTISNM